jgi:glycosyltransferase involved in cell wall biosynthesis
MNRPPRLLIIDKTGGLPTSRERTEAIAQVSGFEVHLLCPSRWQEHGMRFDASGGTDGPVTIHVAPVSFPGYYARAFYRRGFRQVLRTVKPDIIHLLEEPYSLFTLQTLLLARRHSPNARIVFYTWENIDRGFNYPARIQFLYRYADRLSHRLAHGAVCATPDAQKVLSRKGFAKETIVAPYGVESCYLSGKTIEMDPHRKSPVMGYVGRLLPMKGVDLLIKALPGLKDIDLELVGAGPEKDSLERLARQLGVGERVHFLGAMPAEDVRKTMATWDLLVLPSRETPLWMEQLGRVLLEAMALGVPIVAADTGSIPWVVGESGLLFRQDDLEGFLSAVQDLLGNRDHTNLRVQKGKERIRTEFTWPVFAERVTDLYRRLL